MAIKRSIQIVAVIGLTVSGLLAYLQTPVVSQQGAGLEEVANGDAQFWLMQDEPNNRYIPCDVYYYFDKPLDADLVLSRLKDLVAPYKMFKRNVVEINGLPYWQDVEPDWSKNFRVLDASDDIEAIRKEADAQVSTASDLGEGLPLFRAYLTADRRQLIFIWHHVISDVEGMFNKHALHLFAEKGQRTHFGYQISQATEQARAIAPAEQGDILPSLFDTDRPLGFTKTGFEVNKIIVPVEDNALFAMGSFFGLSMSDIFSLMTMRAVTRYHENENGKGDDYIRPVLSPLSLRQNSLAIDEGNNRAVKFFPLQFPLESIDTMYQRVLQLAPSPTDYDAAGKIMKFSRKYSVVESTMRRAGMPDYISNYFPLADIPLKMNQSNLMHHNLRLPMVPYERTKFAWSNYNGQVQLYLHTDPLVVDKERMAALAKQSIEEVLAFLYTDNTAAFIYH